MGERHEQGVQFASAPDRWALALLPVPNEEEIDLCLLARGRVIQTDGCAGGRV